MGTVLSLVIQIHYNQRMNHLKLVDVAAKNMNIKIHGTRNRRFRKKSDTIRFASKSMYGCLRDKGHKLRNVHHKGTPLTAMPRLVDGIAALVLSGFLLI